MALNHPDGGDVFDDTGCNGRIVCRYEKKLGIDTGGDNGRFGMIVFEMKCKRFRNNGAGHLKTLDRKKGCDPGHCVYLAQVKIKSVGQRGCLASSSVFAKATP
jgi:hypothetical protein